MKEIGKRIGIKMDDRCRLVIYSKPSFGWAYALFAVNGDVYRIYKEQLYRAMPVLNLN